MPTPEKIAATDAAQAATDAAKAASDAADATRVAAAAEQAKEAARLAELNTVPKTYDLKVPDTFTGDATLVERTAARARTLGLNNARAQGLLDATVEEVTTREAALAAKQAEGQQHLVTEWSPGGTKFVERQTQWEKAVQADPELGATPEVLKATMAVSLQAIGRFGTPALTQLLEDTGFGSHPEVVRVFAKIGRAMAEGENLHGNNGRPNTGEKTAHQKMYPGHYNDDGSPKTPG